MMNNSKIRIIEVGPRDGLQNEKIIFSPAKRFQLIKKLIDAGVKDLEIGSFVSPKWVPQMAKTEKVIEKCHEAIKNKEIPSKLSLACLVPNSKGMEDAIKSNIKEVALFAACSESFSNKNINCSIEESFQRFLPVVQMAKKKKIRLRGYLSTVFGCPYEGAVDEKIVVELAKKMLNLGVYEISFGDTIGVANPLQVESVIRKLKRSVPTEKIAMHFHDTRGMALANIHQSVVMGIRNFDSSIGGLGGCPYANGASGNVATEDVVNMLHSMGYSTGLEIDKLVKLSHWLEKQLGRKLPSKMSQVL